MAKSTVYRRTRFGGAVSFNLTPMIDVTFQLIIFFILASQIASAALANLDPPEPYQSQAGAPKQQKRKPNKVIVNVISAEPKGTEDPLLAGEAGCYQIAGARIEIGDIETLTDILSASRSRAENAEEFMVEIRADKRVSFAAVQPVMAAASRAGIAKMGLTALIEQKE